MALRYLLDTNTVSYAIQGYSIPLRERMDSTTNSSMALSVFTQAELLYGLARKPEAKKLRSAVEKFLSDLRVLSWDSAAATAYGDLRAVQESKGRPLSHEDLMIAAHALSLGLTLVTHDQAFSFVDGLKTEDWTVAD
jgi:tRNA(fMet)-specific endonuclease VapC